MSERKETKGPMTNEEVRTFYRELRDGINIDIGKLEAVMADGATTSVTSSIASWLKYILEHIRYQYELLESASFSVRDIRSAAENLDSKIREFDKHKPTLEFIESTEMTNSSQVSTRDD